MRLGMNNGGGWDGMEWWGMRRNGLVGGWSGMAANLRVVLDTAGLGGCRVANVEVLRLRRHLDRGPVAS